MKQQPDDRGMTNVNEGRRPRRPGQRDQGDEQCARDGQPDREEGERVGVGEAVLCADEPGAPQQDEDDRRERDPRPTHDHRRLARRSVCTAVQLNRARQLHRAGGFLEGVDERTVGAPDLAAEPDLAGAVARQVVAVRLPSQLAGLVSEG